MKRKIATAVAWAIAAGACGVAIVQAQTTPPSYVLARINVKDENKNDFLLKAQANIKAGFFWLFVVTPTDYTSPGQFEAPTKGQGGHEERRPQNAWATCGDCSNDTFSECASADLDTGRHAKMQAQSKHRVCHLRPSVDGMRIPAGLRSGASLRGSYQHRRFGPWRHRRRWARLGGVRPPQRGSLTAH